MLIKELIKQLEELEATYDEEYRRIMGEPEICIDLFRPTYPGSPNYARHYAGISGEILIEKLPLNWYCPVISAFAEDYENPSLGAKAAQISDRATAWPESWEA